MAGGVNNGKCGSIVVLPRTPQEYTTNGRNWREILRLNLRLMPAILTSSITAVTIVLMPRRRVKYSCKHLRQPVQFISKVLVICSVIGTHRHMKESSKYYPLYQFFQQNDKDVILLTVADVQSILGGRLPARARVQRAWWSNRRTANAQSAAWLSAGYRVDELNLEENPGRIVFRREGAVPPQEIRREGDIVMWNGAMIKALREHMGLNQAEFAQELGVRQPTVSEWETGAYAPKRSSSKLLMLIAEQAHFSYDAS